MNINLKGKTALVTGSSRGIGKAIALELAANGADIILHYAGNKDAAEQAKTEVEKYGVNCRVLSADLRNPDSCKALIENAGGIDILVLNASVQYKKKWHDITVQDATDQLNCNFVSSLLLIQQAVPFMEANKWGRIVTVGSVQEAKPHPDMLVYSASKAAQTNMVQSLSLQLAKSGITVNNVAPGVIYTDRNVEALSDPEYAKIVTDSIPVGFYGTPDDCAGTVALLCSDAGRYITGQSIYIDGGKSL